jgi:hypothetical protein
MSSALIGHTGFVGSTLKAARKFDDLFDSSNIESIRGRSYDTVFCAAPHAKKWWANKFPAEDRDLVEGLMDVLSTADINRFVLISTIDVFPVVSGIDDTFDCHSLQNHAYGSNRLALEDFAVRRFPISHVIRLPGLFGAGLRKNAIYDMLHLNEVEKINPDGVFQWYDMRRLGSDIDTILERDIRLLLMATAPIKTSAIQQKFFPQIQIGAAAGPATVYDIRTHHAAAFGGHDGYIMNAPAILQRIGSYILHEQNNPYLERAK